MPGPTRYRKPARLTISVTGSTVVAAAAAAATLAAVTPASAAPQPGVAHHPTATRLTARQRARSAARRTGAQRRTAWLTSAVTPVGFSWELTQLRSAAEIGQRQAAAAARSAAMARAAKAAAARAAAARAAAASAAAAAQAAAKTAPDPAPPVSSGSPQQIAESMLASYGWSQSQFSCLDPLWSEESGWNVNADNPTSGAYGIPQALPGSRMASAGPDWQSDAATQIRWGLNYIQSTYGSPCNAWAHEQADGWY
jgi:hypothetical protein